MNQLFSMLIAVSCLFAPAAASAISVTVDDVPLVLDVEPAVVNGRTLVPMRPIFEALGAEIEWDNASKGITAYKDSKTINLYLNDTLAYINGASYVLDTPVVSIDGRTMVPARFVAESLDCQVFWDNSAKCVSVYTNAEAAQSYTVQQEELQAKEAEEARLAAEAAERERIQQQSAQPQDVQDRTVYVTKTGKRYHYDDSCNGGTYIASTLSEALSRGLTPCQKCIG